jgi:2-keto-3-deoxy-L-rhamnonate aldolase RhmA
MDSTEKVRAIAEQFRKQCRGGKGIGFEEFVAQLTDLLDKRERENKKAVLAAQIRIVQSVIELDDINTDPRNRRKVLDNLLAELQAAQEGTQSE